MYTNRSQYKKEAFLTSLLVGLILPGLLTACGNGPGTTRQNQPVHSTPSPSLGIQTLTVTAIDYSYLMPQSLHVRAGLLDLTLVNNGTQPHQEQLARLRPGVTSNEVVNELITKRKEAEAFSLLTFVGGPDTISPGDGQETIVDVSAGQYALLCLVTGPDGLPHIDKGMIDFLTVSAAQQSQTLPQAEGDIVMQDHGYLLPSSLSQQRVSTFKVENRGSQPHELNIVRLASGKSAQDVLAFFRGPAGPPPFEEAGGMATLAPGASGWIITHLEPGHYAMLSAVPDPQTGAFQLTQGLLTTFTVQ
jgi:outer membrane protein assembly factor BamE (lipoprotein component of BamABCDE complex)